MTLPHKMNILCAFLLSGFCARSQTFVDSIGKPVSENFNSLTTSNVVSAWKQNSTLVGWYAYEMDPYSKAIDHVADSGTSTGGRLYSYGRASNSERALGSLSSSGNDSIVFGWRLKNNTGLKIDSVKISFTGEQWRRTSGTAANKLVFCLKTSPAISSVDSVAIRNLAGNGFIHFPGLDFSSPQTGAITSMLNGNDPANSKFLSETMPIMIAPGDELFLLWLDDDEAGNDHGLAIDDISVTFLNKPVLPPKVSFLTNSIISKESDTAFIELKIENSNDKPTSVTIEKKSGTSKNGSDYILNFPLIITFPSFSDSNQHFIIPLVNDLIDEPDKTLELVIRKTDNGGEIAEDSIINIIIRDNDNPRYQIKTVSKTDGFGVPDSNNVKVQVQGIVYGVNYRPSGLQFTIRDSSGGIGVFHPVGNFDYVVSEGDEILISGTMGHFRGLAQLSFIDTVVKLQSGLPLISPVIVSQLGEFTESNLIKIKGLRWAQPKPNKWVANSTYKFTNGKDTFQVRIDGDITLAETVTPAYDTMNITGIGGQVSTSSFGPFLDGYLLYPRYRSDIERSDPNSGSVKRLNTFISVYPNPVDGMLEIISYRPMDFISIFSITGEIAFEMNADKSFEKKLVIDLPPGIYTLKVVSANDISFKRLIVK